MKWRDASKLAWADLSQSRLRSALTVLGVMVGIASLICMFAFGLGMQKISTEHVTRNNARNVITAFPMPPFLQDPDERPSTPPPPLDEALLDRMRRLDGVAGVTPVINFPARATGPKGPFRLTGRTVSVPGDLRGERFPLDAGAFFTSNAEDAVIVHPDLLPRLGLPREPPAGVGGVLRLRLTSPARLAATVAAGGNPAEAEEEVPLRVAGVLKKGEEVFENPLRRTDILLPLDTARRLGLHQLNALGGLGRMAGGSLYTLVEITVADPARLPVVQEQVEKMGLRAVSLHSILKEMNVFFLVFNSVLGAVGSIALVVAGIGIVNTMIIAVLERRKDIGIMKSVGASRGDIRRQFFMAAAWIGLTGGILGELLGWGVASVVNFVALHFIRQQGPAPETLFHYPAWLIAGCIGFAVLVALVSALYPASRAARLNPVDALRYE